MDARLPRSETPTAVTRDYPGTRPGLDVRWRLLFGIAGAIALVILAWRFFAPRTDGPQVPPPPPVRVATAVRQNVTVQEHTIGTIVANSTVQITSRVEGQIAAAHFKEGDIVHQGDLLFELDPRPFQAAVAQAVATQS